MSSTLFLTRALAVSARTLGGTLVIFVVTKVAALAVFVAALVHQVRVDKRLQHRPRTRDDGQHRLYVPRHALPRHGINVATAPSLPDLAAAPAPSSSSKSASRERSARAWMLFPAVT